MSSGSLICRAARLSLAVITCLSICSCETVSSGTSLVSLTGISPKELGISEELEIQGNGLPEGKSARVAFRGDLYHPGSRVDKDVEIVARTTTSSPRSLSILMNEQLRAAFVGAGDAAKHTTFRGDIEVSFSPKKTGMPPITGTLSDVVLDIEAPLVSEALQQQRDVDATGALAFLGITLRGVETGDCCVVANASGRAEAAGLVPGDLLVDLDGVTVQNPFDLVPSGRSRVARLTYRRAGAGPFITRDLDVQGYRSAAPSELGPALGLVAFFAFSLLLTATRLGRPLEWLAHWLSLRLREARSNNATPARASQPRAAWLRNAVLGLPDEPGWALLTIMILIANSVLATLIGLHVDLVSPELDLVLWILLQSVSLAWAAALGKLARSAKSMWTSLKSAAEAVLYQVPLVALALTVVLTTRSLRLSELSAAQGTAIRAYHFLANPALLLLTLLATLALLPEATHVSPFEAKKVGRLFAFTAGLGRVLSGTVHLWSSSLLITLLCFGGHRVPFVSPTIQSASYAWQVLGVLIWFLKAMGLVAVVAALRQIAGRISTHDAAPTFLRFGIGLTLLGVLGARGWSYVAERYALNWLEDVAAWALFATTIFGLAWTMRSAFERANSTRHDAVPNTWI